MQLAVSQQCLTLGHHLTGEHLQDQDSGCMTPTAPRNMTRCGRVRAVVRPSQPLRKRRVWLCSAAVLHHLPWTWQALHPVPSNMAHKKAEDQTELPEPKFPVSGRIPAQLPLSAPIAADSVLRSTHIKACAPCAASFSEFLAFYQVRSPT